MQTINLTDEINHANATLANELQQAALFSVAGQRLALLPADLELPPSSSVLRFGRPPEAGQTAVDSTWVEVRDGFSGYCARYAVIAMVGSCETYLQRLLFIATLASQMKGKGGMRGSDFYRIRDSVGRKVRRLSVDGVALAVCEVAGVQQPAVATLSCFRSVYALRRCLLHRGGVVGVDDVDENSLLNATWRRAVFEVDGKEITQLPFHVKAGGMLTVRFVEELHEWRLGERLVLSADDCQHICLTLVVFGNEIAKELHKGVAGLLATQ